MVYPVNEIIFKINTLGRTLPGTFVVIKDMETFSLAFDNSVEEWNAMDMAGWIRRLMTGKSVTIGLNGKRNYGDAGNDYVSGLALLNGNLVNSILQMVFPNSDTLNMPCVVNVTASGGGDSTAVGALEFECLSDGAPTYATGAGNLGALTFVCTDGTGAGATQVAAVSPVLGGGNSYLMKINGTLPLYGTSLTGLGWIAYTLGTDIATAVGNSIVLVEISAGLAIKGGTAAAVIV